MPLSSSSLALTASIVVCRRSSLSSLSVSVSKSCGLMGLAHVYRESTLDPCRSSLSSYLAFYHHLPPLKPRRLSLKWGPVTTRSLLSQARLPLNPQEESSGGIIQSQPLPEYLALVPGSLKTRKLPGTTTRTRLSTLIGWAVWALLAKNRSIGRLPCQPGTPNAVSLLFLHKHTDLLFLQQSLITLIAFKTQPGGTLTPHTLNSLSVIDGHEGEEEDWEREMRDLNRDDEVSAAT